MNEVTLYYQHEGGEAGACQVCSSRPHTFEREVFIAGVTCS